jgi:beta-barrel assembly-enhancing protease
MKRVGLLYALCMCLMALVVAPCLATSQQQEEELGKEYAKQVEQQCKLVKDKSVSERVDRIGQALAQIANTDEVKASYGTSNISKFTYRFKVIEDKDVNAFSLPGGYVYVNTGLVELAKSDDEIAGVLAHEIAHSAHHHMAQLVKKQSVVDRYVAIITLAGVLSNMRSQDLNNLLYGVQMIRTGKMSSYTMEAERDADRTAVSYLVKSSYKPEGMLTFMKKLEAKHDSNPTVTLGIYQDHPAPFRRVASIAKAMKAEGIAVDERKERGFAYATPVQVDAGDGSRYQVTIGNRVLFTPASLQSGGTSKQRAEALAGAVNKLLDSGVTSAQVIEDKSEHRLLAKGSELLKLDAADAALVGKNDGEVLDQARSALEYAMWADWLCDRCPVVQQASADTSD